ncbi:hypothetical protein GLP37_22035 [Photobacterium phosphoreum]|uniref:hypothetical protein n=1 Tax=Photobacterium phosphoreum TaxID=659 RepID=UPI001E4A5091|nr:hypothetical protein [Photobacterium phosphoreum]MCD9504845.1 hypothetical protein [Photobacterium phosphoreum]
MKAIVIFLGVILAGCNSEPNTYDDCLLYHLDKAKTKAGVGLLYRACRGKFPSPKPVIKKTKAEDYQLADDFNIEDFRSNSNK